MAAPLRSSTPDAPSGHCFVADWSGGQVPFGSLSAPSSVTKGQVLRSRGMLSLSPSLLNQRLSQVEQSLCATPYARTPASAVQKSWGQSMAFENAWTFWLESADAGGQRRLEQMGDFCHTKDFWGLFNNLSLTDLPVGSGFYLFKSGIRPIWDDDSNINGGHFSLGVSQAARGKAWLDLALALVGEQMEGADLVCGAGIHAEGEGCTLSLWVCTRDPTMQVMLGDQFSKFVGQSGLPSFTLHQRLIRSPELAGRPHPATPDGARGEGRFRDGIAAARAAHPRRRTNSAPSPVHSRGQSLAPEDGEAEMYPTAHSTLAPRRGVNASSGLGLADSPSAPSLDPAVAASLPEPLRPPAPPSTGSSEGSAERRARAAVRSLDPQLLGGPQGRPGIVRPQGSGPPSARRSRSDSHRELVVVSKPLTPMGGEPQPRRHASYCGGAARQLLGGGGASLQGGGPNSPPFGSAGWAVAHGGQSPARTPQAWADGFSPTELERGAWTQPLWARRNRIAEGADRADPWAPPGPAPAAAPAAAPPAAGSAADPHHIWQLHQRVRDRRLAQQQEGGEAAGGAQGKSASLAFVHRGYLYPPGLNRKQRRAVIFNSDGQRRGEVAVPDGQYVGSDVPDGPLTEEELAALQAARGYMTVPAERPGAAERAPAPSAGAAAPAAAPSHAPPGGNPPPQRGGNQPPRSIVRVVHVVNNTGSGGGGGAWRAPHGGHGGDFGDPLQAPPGQVLFPQDSGGGLAHAGAAGLNPGAAEYAPRESERLTLGTLGDRLYPHYRAESLQGPAQQQLGAGGAQQYSVHGQQHGQLYGAGQQGAHRMMESW